MFGHFQSFRITVVLGGILLAQVATNLVCPGNVQAFQGKVEVLTEIENQKELLKQFGNQTSGVIKEKDRLTFLVRSDAAKVELANMLGAKLNKQVSEGFHMGQIKVANSDQLLMSYAFQENDENAWRMMKHYRGPSAPEIPQSVSRLSGTHHQFQLESEHLPEPRRVDVYSPSGGGDEPLPVVYLTDGNALESIVGSLDWMIQNGDIAPVVVVGIHNAGYIGDRKKVYNPELDHRAKEYLSGIGSDRYAKHNSFLSEDLLPYIEEHFNATDNPKNRVLSGYSNGGAYAVTASVDHPDWFGKVFAYSVAYFDRDELKKNVQGKELPEYRFAAGTLESFIKGTTAANKILKDAGFSTSMRSYVAGHDPLMWKIALLEDLKACFPGPSAGLR